MGDHTNEAKLAALESLSPTRSEGRFVWESEDAEGNTVALEDITLPGSDKPVTLYTVFKARIPAEVRDDFVAGIFEMREANELGIGADEKRTVSVSPRPTNALKILALGGAIEEGVWAVCGDGEGGLFDPRELPKDDRKKAELLSLLETPAIHMLLNQAIEYYLGKDLGRAPNALAEAVDDAGKSHTSAGDN